MFFNTMSIVKRGLSISEGTDNPPQKEGLVAPSKSQPPLDEWAIINYKI